MTNPARDTKNDPEWVEEQGRLMTSTTRWWMTHLPTSTLSCKHKKLLSDHCNQCSKELDDGA